MARKGRHPKQEFAARVVIGHFSGDSRGVHIEISDDASGIRICDLYLDHKTFGEALGSSYVKCKGELYDNFHIVGADIETKTEVVFVPDGGYDTRTERGEKAVRMYEKDGWVARVSDAENGHCIEARHKDGNDMRVLFTRFVKNGKPIGEDSNHAKG